MTTLPTSNYILATAEKIVAELGDEDLTQLEISKRIGVKLSAVSVACKLLREATPKRIYIARYKMVTGMSAVYKVGDYPDAASPLTGDELLAKRCATVLERLETLDMTAAELIAITGIGRTAMQHVINALHDQEKIHISNFEGRRQQSIVWRAGPGQDAGPRLRDLDAVRVAKNFVIPPPDPVLAAFFGLAT